MTPYGGTSACSPACAVRAREIFEPHALRAFFEQPQDQDRALEVEDADTDDLVRRAGKLMVVERAKELLLDDAAGDA